MSKYVINCDRIFTPYAIEADRIWVSDGLIVALGDKLGEDLPDTFKKSEYEPINLKGLVAGPGLFDLQVNGSPECNLWANPSSQSLIDMRRQSARRGVTSFLPTLITGELDTMAKTRDFLVQQGAGNIEDTGTGSNSGLARMPGIHLEGPCLSPARPGVHPAKNIQPLNLDVLKKLITPQIMLMTAALEGDESGQAQTFLQDRNVRLSLGHSNATFEEAKRSFERGARLLTHTFNALPPLHHREPGAVGAALLDHRVTCCLIPDGLHLAPAICDLIIRLKGSDRAILVSDRATVGTSKGTLVGSSITLNEAVANLIQWNICDLSDALLMASTNPFRCMGLSHRLGQIGAGYLADMVFFNDKIEVEKTMLAGELIE